MFLFLKETEKVTGGNMKKVLLFAAIICLVSLGFSQTYTMEQLIEDGMKNSVTIKISKNSYETTQSQLRTSKWNLAPEVDANLRWSNDLLNTPSPAGNPTNSIGLSVAKNISWNDPLYYQYKYASFDYQTAKYSYDTQVRQFVYKAFNLYLTLLNTKKQIVSQEEDYKIQQKITEESQFLLAKYKITQYEAKQSEIAEINSKIEIEKLKNLYDQQREELFTFLNLKDEGYPLTDLEFQTGWQIPQPDFESVLDIKILERDVARSKISVTQNRAEFLPSLSLQYNYNRAKVGSDLNFEKYSTTHTVSLNASYSLWNYFRNSENVHRIKLTQKNKELALEDKKTVITNQYQQAVKDLEYLNKLNSLYQEKLSSALENLNIAMEQYKLGMIKQIEIDKSRSEYLNTKILLESNQNNILLKREAINQLLSKPILNKW